MSVNKFTRDFLCMLESINSIRERIIWSFLSCDFTDEALFNELLDIVETYKSNIQNPPSETKKE